MVYKGPHGSGGAGADGLVSCVHGEVDPQARGAGALEGPVVATITGGTILWFVLFLVQLPFYGWFDDHGHLWWVWTCLAGAGLGLIGIWYVRGRDAALKKAAAEAEQQPSATTE